MRIEIIQSPQGRAILAGQVGPVDTKKKHWMAKIVGLDEKFGFNRDFLKRAIYDKKGKAAGYSIEGAITSITAVPESPGLALAALAVLAALRVRAAAA